MATGAAAATGVTDPTRRWSLPTQCKSTRRWSLPTQRKSTRRWSLPAQRKSTRRWSQAFLCVYSKAARAVSYSFCFCSVAELMCFSSRGCDKDTHYRLPGGMPTA